MEENKTMRPKEVAEILSQTMRDVSERKLTLRHALVMARMATALAKVIETSDLNDRIEFLEEVLKKKK